MCISKVSLKIGFENLILCLSVKTVEVVQPLMREEDRFIQEHVETSRNRGVGQCWSKLVCTDMKVKNTVVSPLDSPSREFKEFWNGECGRQIHNSNSFLRASLYTLIIYLYSIHF